MKTYSTRGKRKPTKVDANVKGFVFARKRDGFSFAGVEWFMVRWPEYDRWSPAEFYAVPGDRTTDRESAVT